MGSTAIRLALSVLLVVAGVAALGPAGTAATPPVITLTVDGTSVADGESTLVKTDPTLDVSVDANRSIRVVSVRVDGETVHRATPNDTSFAESVDVDISSGEHTVAVVVKTDRVTTHEVTVTKDAARPYVRYTTPFETDQYAPPPDSVSVNRSRIVLAGNFTDVTGVSHLQITRRTTYEAGTVNRNDTEIYTATDLNGSFAQPVFLGVGRNNITARYYDRAGHQRVHRFRIVVEDTAPPTLSNLSAIRTSPSTLRIGGSATDNGQIRSVAIRPANESGTTYLVNPGFGRPDRTRARVSFRANRTLYPGSTAVVVEATDTAGNTVERTVTVRRTVAPDLRIDPTATRFVNAGGGGRHGPRDRRRNRVGKRRDGRSGHRRSGRHRLASRRRRRDRPLLRAPSRRPRGAACDDSPARHRLVGDRTRPFGRPAVDDRHADTVGHGDAVVCDAGVDGHGRTDADPSRDARPDARARILGTDGSADRRHDSGPVGPRRVALGAGAVRRAVRRAGRSGRGASRRRPRRRRPGTLTTPGIAVRHRD